MLPSIAPPPRKTNENKTSKKELNDTLQVSRCALSQNKRQTSLTLEDPQQKTTNDSAANNTATMFGSRTESSRRRHATNPQDTMRRRRDAPQTSRREKRKTNAPQQTTLHTAHTQDSVLAVLVESLCRLLSGRSIATRSRGLCVFFRASKQPPPRYEVPVEVAATASRYAEDSLGVRAIAEIVQVEMRVETTSWSKKPVDAAGWPTLSRTTVFRTERRGGQTESGRPLAHWLRPERDVSGRDVAGVTSPELVFFPVSFSVAAATAASSLRSGWSAEACS